ncbi:YcaO-like family protein [Actinokineospora enzanensis]|uniref:YcaO-like family protein n=1 Tax=Actinokineospora enzanensis TaxID=155975 RepID=UPI00035D2E51|nr:YcaO-like family protein [Actinokineospora enzanensis]
MTDSDAATTAVRRLLRDPALVRRLTSGTDLPALLTDLDLADIPAELLGEQPPESTPAEPSGVAGVGLALLAAGRPGPVVPRLEHAPPATPTPPPGDGPHLTEIKVHGQTLRAAKLDGELRSVPVTETLRRIQPLFAGAGITRLADITGLDRVGIPVTMAIRPNGRTLSNHAGKGTSLDAAMASAAMEALENHYADEWRPDTFRCSYRQVRQLGAVPEWHDLPLARHAPRPESWPYLWTWGWDLINDEQVALPVSMLHMGNRDERILDLCAFQITSNGLASGNNLIEAIHSGLLEVIERDACTCHKVRWLRRRTPPPVLDPSTIESAAVHALLDRLDEADVDSVIFDCSVDTATPVYMADVIDRSRQVPGTFRGYGAHLDPEVALVRALTEAVQARTITIAGSRDDLFRHRYVHRGSEREYERMDALTSGSMPRADRPGPSEATTTVEHDVLLLVERLRGAGLDRVIVVRMSDPDAPISVVKVVVPGLEGYQMENFMPQHRALAFAAGTR